MRASNNIRDYKRFEKLTSDLASNLDVCLKNNVVLTEVGSNLYLYNPIIPLICGAEYVYAFVKDTYYGKANEIKNSCLEIAEFLGFSDKLEIGLNELNESWINKADIVTNSGMLRPFNRSRLSKFKKGAVLPLMFEAWELRDRDIDLVACKEFGISVAGTWENHPLLKVFDFVEMLALKMVFEAGFEVQGNNIYIWSNDHFGDKIYSAFMRNGCNKCYLGIDFKELLNLVVDLDFIFIADYDESKSFFELLQIDLLIKINPRLTFLHLYGDVDFNKFETVGASVYPRKNGKHEMMTFTLAHVGMAPYVALQVGGYKVAQNLINNVDSDIVQKI
ncbi:MAG: hypothetical protein RLZ10_2072 [Bacteroidota bacterium]|jgi:hypothetical protein